MKNKSAHCEPVSPAGDPWENFDLPAALDEMRSGTTWKEGDRVSRLLFKGFGMRVILVAMRSGAIVSSHKGDCALSLLVLEGRLRLETEGDSSDLGHGHLATVEPGIRHAIEALEDTAFLLTLAKDQPHPAQT